MKEGGGSFGFEREKECEMGEEGGLGNRQRRNGVEREVRLEREKVSLDHLRIELCAFDAFQLALERGGD